MFIFIFMSEYPTRTWSLSLSWVNISGTIHANMVMWGVVSEDLGCPKLKFHGPKCTGCPRKKITFFSEGATSQIKPKVVPVPHDPQVYGGIGPHFGGICHFTFPLQGQCGLII